MKKQLLFSGVMLFGSLVVKSQSPASSSTFSPNFCYITTTIVAIPNTVDCFSFSAGASNNSIYDSFYSWDFGDGSPVENGINVNHCYEPAPTGASGQRLITLTYNDGLSQQCSDMITTNTVVTTVLNWPRNCQFPTPTHSLSAFSLIISQRTLPNNMASSINYGDGTTPDNTGIHTYTNCGNYIVDLSTWELQTQNTMELQTLDTICHNYIAVNVINCRSTGITDNIKESDLIVYPNPSSDFITIKNSNIIKSFTITNILGKIVVLNRNVRNTATQVEISEFNPGTYFINIEDVYGLHYNAKLIKE